MHRTSAFTVAARTVGRSLHVGSYWVSMYTGMRAILNRLRARRGPLPACAAALQGGTLEVPGLGLMRLAVHWRPRPESEPTDRIFAMVSARQVEPRVWAPVYAYLCATSHFGRAHLELALYEERGVWTIHGVRNIAHANAQRLGWTATAEGLSAPDGSGPARLLESLAQHLRARGQRIQLAPAHECVRLSVRPELIPRSRRAATLRALQTRYERLNANHAP